VNDIAPDDRGDGWLFEILFDDGDIAHYDADQLALVEPSGRGHEAEIELALETSSADAAGVAADVERLAGETFRVVAGAQTIRDGGAFVELHPQNHPRPAVRALMERLGSEWLVEDDGWYANVTWAGGDFPVAGVDAVRLFLRPWRDPRSHERLPGEPAD
jgi:hypothetical protein